MADNTIEGFFATLGFKVDAVSEKRFSDSITGAALKANLLASSIEGAAKSIAQHVAQIAANFEAVGYAANRSYDSAQKLKAMGYAVSQLGGSYDDAIKSMERFGENLRSNPGYEAMLKRFGVQTRDAKNQLKSAEDLFKGFLDQNPRMPYGLQKGYAQEFGIDERTFQVYAQRRKELDRLEQQQSARAKAFRFDATQATKSGTEFTQALRGLSDTATIAAEKFYSDLAPALTRIVLKTQAWIDTHPEEINRILNVGEKIVLAFAHAIESVGDAIGPLVTKIGEWSGAIDGKDGLQTKLDTFAQWLLTVWMVKVLAGFLGVGKGWTALLLRLGIPVAIGAAAAGHGFQTPEDYQRSLGSDPGAKAFDDERKRRATDALGGREYDRENDKRSFWQRIAPKMLGGKDAPTREKGGGASGSEVGRWNAAREPEKAGTYRPEYKLSEEDLSQRTADIIAGEAQRRNPESIDAVINNMLNRVGTKGWGPSKNLLQVADAPGQYEAAWKGSKANAKETEFIRSRIRAIASGGVPDNTGGSNSFRASSYAGPWAQKHALDGRVVGGNRFAFEKGTPNGPYAPYDVNAINKVAASADATPKAAPADATPGAAAPGETGEGVNSDLMRVIKRAQEISAVKFNLYEGVRSIERQREMVARGWSKTLDSEHIKGRAVDVRAEGDPAVGKLDPKKYRQIFEAMQQASKETGVPIQWGGNWKGFVDIPHFQLPKDHRGGVPYQPPKLPPKTPNEAFEGAKLPAWKDPPLNTPPGGTGWQKARTAAASVIDRAGDLSALSIAGQGNSGQSNTFNTAPGKVNITVHGAGRPEETSDAVKNAMNDINKASVRGIQSAIR